MFLQCRSTDVQEGRRGRQSAWLKGCGALRHPSYAPSSSAKVTCSPDGAKRNPGRRGRTTGFPRIPLRSMRATISLLFLGQQACVAAGRRGVDGDDLLQGKTAQIIRAARLGSGAGKAASAEGLGPDHGADHVAVDVDIAVRQARRDARDGRVDARMDAEREAVAVRRDVLEQGVELAGLVA